MRTTILYVTAAAVLLTGLVYLWQQPQPSRLQQVLESNELRIATRVGPMTYQPRNYGISGLDYDLARRFAEFLGVEASFHPVHQDSVLTLLALDKVDMAAANLAISKARMRDFLFGPQYHTKAGVLAGPRNQSLPVSLDRLGGFRILVPAGSLFIENLEDLQRNFPEFQWRERKKTGIEDLMNEVVTAEDKLALIDSNEFARIRFLYPGIKKAFELVKPQPVAWAFQKSPDLSLYLKAVEFFQDISLSGELQRLIVLYSGFDEDPEYLDSLRFTERLELRLPEYRDLFVKAAYQTGLDWRLLAAISYQESHWDKDARSHTGVRGLMMLTSQTAEQMNIADRTDPEQSILGGAKYLRSLLERLPERISNPDRLWLALAAYNVGPGHLEDARVITQKQGGDPNQWLDVKPRLRLLADKEWYSQTRHGKARGHEPVNFVENVRRYYEVMKSLDKIEVETDRVERLLARDIVTSPAL